MGKLLRLTCFLDRKHGGCWEEAESWEISGHQHKAGMAGYPEVEAVWVESITLKRVLAYLV